MCWRGRIKSLSNGLTLLTSKDMKKKIAVLTLCAILFVLCGFVHAQQGGTLLRIGYLDSSTAAGSGVLVKAFLQELIKLGWIEGKSFTIDYRFAEQKRERLPELAADLVRLKVDIL